MVKNKCALICCDLTPLIFPQFHTLKVRITNNFMRRAAKNALRVITISEHSAKDIVTHLNIAREKIAIAYPGVDEKFYQEISKTKLEAIRKRLKLPKNFLWGGKFQIPKGSRP